jgi:(p)ppGpp synthase/HD superfamily hydrolase
MSDIHTAAYLVSKHMSLEGVRHSLSVYGSVKRTTEIIELVALLHDLVEDTDVSVETIAGHFGWQVADAVDAISRREGELYLQEYIPRVKKNPHAHIVKVHDLNENLSRDGKDSLKERYRKALELLND